MVKSWVFPEHDGPYVNIVDAAPTQLRIRDKFVPYQDLGEGTYAYKFKRSPVWDTNGVGGQNVQNPASLFNNHVVVGIRQLILPSGTMIDTAIYDPSYGAIYSTTAGQHYLQAMQNEAVAGFYHMEQEMGVVDRYKMVIHKPGNQVGLVKTVVG
jgi:hypothetical protein